MNTVTKRSDELVKGDIVWNHGMRIRIEEIHTGEAYGNTKALEAAGYAPLTYWSVGTVLNVEEVNEAGLVPFSWRCMTRPQDREAGHWSDKGDKWQVQGNSFATWSVEA